MALRSFIGSIDPFELTTEEWIQYFKRFQNFHKANKIEDNNQKAALLLKVMGAGTYKLLQNLAAPADVNT